MLRRSSNLPASFGTALFPWAHRADARRLLGRGQPDSLPIWSCSVWGLPCGSDYSAPGALLPHLFTLTGSCEAGGIFSVALAVRMPSQASVPDVIRHTALRSSDFPPPANAPESEAGSDRPAACSSEFSADDQYRHSDAGKIPVDDYPISSGWVLGRVPLIA